MNVANSIVINDLSFTYSKQKKPTLQKLQLEIPDQSCTLILGPNGAGKSTLMSVICGLLPFKEGSIRFPLHSNHLPYSYGTQNCALYGELTIQENLHFFARLMESTANNSIDTLIEKLHLSPYRNKKINECSGGIKQRTHIAITLLNKAPLLVLDEPFNNIDPESRILITQCLKDYMLENSATVLLSSHQFEAMEDIWTHLAFIHEGKITNFIDKTNIENTETLNKLFFKLKESTLNA